MLLREKVNLKKRFLNILFYIIKLITHFLKILNVEIYDYRVRENIGNYYTKLWGKKWVDYVILYINYTSKNKKGLG